jgi:hypothetical protein
MAAGSLLGSATLQVCKLEALLNLLAPECMILNHTLLRGGGVLGEGLVRACPEFGSIVRKDFTQQRLKNNECDFGSDQAPPRENSSA